MDKQALTDKLIGIAEGVIKSQNLDLVELVASSVGRDLVIRILADRPEGGITIAECANINKEIIRVLDETDVLQQSYILEVSSPGLDRPLKTKSDFNRCKGKLVHFFLSQPINGKWEPPGIINEVRDDSVIIKINEEILEIPLSIINRGKQLLNEA